MWNDEKEEKGIAQQAAEMVFGVAVMGIAMGIMGSMMDSLGDAFSGPDQGAEISGAELGDLTPSNVPDVSQGIGGVDIGLG